MQYIPIDGIQTRKSFIEETSCPLSNEAESSSKLTLAHLNLNNFKNRAHEAVIGFKKAGLKLGAIFVASIVVQWKSTASLNFCKKILCFRKPQPFCSEEKTDSLKKH